MSYFHPRKSTLPHTRVADIERRLGETPVGLKAYKQSNIYDVANELDREFGFKVTHTKSLKGYTYSFIENPVYPNVKIVNYKKDDEPFGHRITFIKRGKETEYYNSNGGDLGSIPEPVRFMLVHNEKIDFVSAVKSIIHNHQEALPLCAECSVMRAIYSETPNKEYHKIVSKDGTARPIEIIDSAVTNTLKHGSTKDVVQPVSMKKGGIVKARRSYL